jgi:hypothetical protein
MSGQPSIRKGKWIPTEEVYTLRLMAEFKNSFPPLSSSPPIPEGTKLRQFLAQALNCDPLGIRASTRGPRSKQESKGGGGGGACVFANVAESRHSGWVRSLLPAANRVPKQTPLGLCGLVWSQWVRFQLVVLAYLRTIQENWIMAVERKEFGTNILRKK